VADFSLSTFLATSGRTILIEIKAVKGSAPRETGTFMLVSETGLWETIGGGQFEYMAIDHARAMLKGKASADTLDIPLGPEIGQCCGGRTLLRFTHVTPDVADTLSNRLRKQKQENPAVFIFGAGHVGKALANALSLLPLNITVIETRPAELAGLPPSVDARASAMPEAVIATIPSGSAVIIVTHDHAVDFLIAREALARTDLAYVGMIGSKTKRATFAHWLEREGDPISSLDRLILPIGGNSVRDKRPAVIAALVAAELLQAFSAFENSSGPLLSLGLPVSQDHV
jgi:xanthine dehydrogenase accessory factor